MNTRFAAASLRIKYIPVDGTMMIDTDTARNLELVGNKIHQQKSTHSLFGLNFFPLRKSADAYSSVLHRVLNHTYTAMASRLLRVNLLSPITGKFSSPTHQNPF